MAKYRTLNLGQIEALVNKVGGMQGVERILSGATKSLPEDQAVESKPEKEPVIKTEWHVTPGALGVSKEMLDGKSLFNWCCGRRMRHILAYQKHDGKTYRLGQGIPLTMGLYCKVCERREDTTSMF